MLKDKTQAYNRLRDWFIRPFTKFKGTMTGRQAVEKLWGVEDRPIIQYVFIKATTINHSSVKSLKIPQQPRGPISLDMRIADTIIVREEADSVHFDYDQRHYSMPHWLYEALLPRMVALPSKPTYSTVNRLLKARNLRKKQCQRILASLRLTSKPQA